MQCIHGLQAADSLRLIPSNSMFFALCVHVPVPNADIAAAVLQGQSQAAASAVAAAVGLPNANAGVIIQALAQTVSGVDDG